MEVKKITEGMTAPQVAQVIDDNFKGIIGETDAKLSELESDVVSLKGAQYTTSKDFDGTKGGSVAIDCAIAANTPFTILVNSNGVTPSGANFAASSVTFADGTTSSNFTITEGIIKTRTYEQDVVKVSVWIPYDNGVTVVASGTVNMTVEVEGVRPMVSELEEDVTTLQQNETYPIATDVLFWNSKKELLNYVHQLSHYSTINGKYGVTPIVLAHFSDIHASETTLNNIISICDYYKDYIDDILHTGDSNNDHYEEDSFSFWSDNPNADSILNIIGNHDAETRLDSGERGEDRTSEECYNQFFASRIETWGVEYTAGKCYWYKDYPLTMGSAEDSIVGIRLIALDSMHLEDEQYSFLSNALEDARANNYAVVAAMHHQPGAMTQVDCNFNSLHRYGKDEVVNGFPAYIQDYIDNGGEFICWLCGHTHRDKFGILSDYPNQTVIVIDKCAPETWWTDHACSYGKAKMIMNLIAFDTTDKLIKILRIGNDCDRFMRHIGMMSYNYKEHKVLFSMQ